MEDIKIHLSHHKAVYRANKASIPLFDYCPSARVLSENILKKAELLIFRLT